jgi:hypothetical protein
VGESFVASRARRLVANLAREVPRQGNRAPS